jgi:four helix bundle protein
MSAVSRFEELDIWRMARKLANCMPVLVHTRPSKNDFTITDQIKRSSGSVMDNIAVGYEKNGITEFIQYQNFAKGMISNTFQKKTLGIYGESNFT